MQKVLVLGKTGLIGSVFLEEQKDNFELLAPEMDEVDILKPDTLKAYFDKNSPQWVINLTYLQSKNINYGFWKGIL